ncbi:MAG TPA: NADH:flavin oxidoreductase/NADH oxidase [Hyphomicrobiaceae bacterium]|nr:NADH:flavin oxidoreductase/NADH oxidase [Hyphomicrobiaceae bacterium]
MLDKPETDLPLLFTPIAMRGVTARNRIVASPMCQYASEDGGPNDWQLAHLGRLAIGGCGIVFGEESAVEARGRKTYTCAGIWNDKHIPLYNRINDFLKAYGSTPAIQLGHSGRKASCHDAIKDWAPLTEADAADGLPPWQGVAPSPIPKEPGSHIPKEMTQADIDEVLQAFADSARRSLKAGYEIVEIHGAHGYLIHQFLSPISNKRTDSYGGSLENRMRFALQVTEATRVAWPEDKPLFFRISAVDGQGGVWSADDSIALSRGLKDRGVDFIDCSSGGIIGSASMSIMPRLPGFQVPFAERVRSEVGIATVAVGMITEGAQAEAILQDGQADLIALARELMWYADWPAHAARAMGIEGYGIMPERYAHRLKLRDRQQKMAVNQPTPENYATLSALVGKPLSPGPYPRG